MTNTKELASTALDAASDKIRDLRVGARDLAHRGANNLGNYTQATTRYVSERPLQSALIAAAVGAAIAGLVIALRRSENRYY
ncbi:glycine zipper domain-containing protein [Caenimonas koreensis]|uniref:DUF883 domain-containing protein n=1 Tax=Caenimonas koreensis DSM 17982 TaxID=1121255 RepID=A0A844AV45_9BURK|nr:hypothetical protein [Caenimonas koreensis]MRD46258.1 hypothetical protein [Caenimonas koreensis DSM 17982]